MSDLATHGEARSFRQMLHFATASCTLAFVPRRTKTAAERLAQYDAVLREFMHGVSAVVVGEWDSPEPPRQLSAEEWLAFVEASLEELVATPRGSGPGDEETFRREVASRLTVAAAVMRRAKEARDRAWTSPKAVGEWHTIGNHLTTAAIPGARTRFRAEVRTRAATATGPRGRAGQVPRRNAGGRPTRQSRRWPALSRTAPRCTPPSARSPGSGTSTRCRCARSSRRAA